MKPYYQDTDVTIYHGDCKDILPSVAADFLLTDPPYGIAYDTAERKHGHKFDFSPIHGDSVLFNPTPLVDLKLPSIIWGANCFSSALPDSPGWISWLKTAPEAIARPGRTGVKLRKADMELAWTNFVRRPQSFIVTWIGSEFDWVEGQGKFHPTQKPVSLMDWCLRLAPITCDTVLDPYMGGGTTLVAATGIEGWHGIGIDIEERYCETAAKRLRHLSEKLFKNKMPRAAIEPEEEAGPLSYKEEPCEPKSS